MDQQKIGALLKELRKEKGLTQEQFAEVFNVSNRTVSRWENGNNMPDIDIIIEISDFYEIELRELLNGERKSENMDKETKENILAAADYTATETRKFTDRMRRLFAAGVILWSLSSMLRHIELPIDPSIAGNIEALLSGLGCGIMLCGAIFAGCFGQKLRRFKQRLLEKK